MKSCKQCTFWNKECYPLDVNKARECSGFVHLSELACDTPELIKANESNLIVAICNLMLKKRIDDKRVLIVLFGCALVWFLVIREFIAWLY